MRLQLPRVRLLWSHSELLTARQRTLQAVLGLGLVSSMSGGDASAQTAVVLPYSPSLTAETSNQLIENGLDDLQHPSMLAGLDKGALYTLLTNQSSGMEYFLGTAFNLGPGGLAILANLYGDGNQSTFSEIYYDDTDDELGNVAGVAWNQRRKMNLYAGYGLPVRPLHVGVGMRIGLDRLKNSADENLYCGGMTYTYNDLEDNTTATVVGSCEQRSDFYQLFGSVHWVPPGKLSLLAEFSFLVRQNFRTLEVEQDSPDYTMSASGTDASSPFSASSSIWLGLDVRPSFQLNDSLLLTGIFSAHAGLFPTDPWAFQTNTWDNTTGIEVTYDTLDTYTPSSVGALDASAFVAARWNASPAASLRLGLGVKRSQSAFSLLHEVEQEVAIESSEDLRQVETFTEDGSNGRTDFIAPVALQIKASDKLAFRISSQYTLSSYRESASGQQLSSELDGEEIPYDNDYYSSTNFSQWSFTRFGAELLFQPSPRTDFSLATSNVSMPRLGATAGGLNLYASATVYW